MQRDRSWVVKEALRNYIVERLREAEAGKFASANPEPDRAGAVDLSHAWPVRTLAFCVTNDFIWWIPFAFYLRDAWPAYRRDLGP